jgi:hypothetical protein
MEQQLEQKKIELQNEINEILKNVNQNNISDLAREIEWYKTRIETIEDVQFLLQNGTWEDVLHFTISK